MFTTTELEKKLGWRKGQFLFNFLAWLKTEKGYDTDVVAMQPSGPVMSSGRMADPFHISDEEMKNLVKEYAGFLGAQIGEEGEG